VCFSGNKKRVQIKKMEALEEAPSIEEWNAFCEAIVDLVSLSLYIYMFQV